MHSTQLRDIGTGKLCTSRFLPNVLIVHMVQVSDKVQGFGMVHVSDKVQGFGMVHVSDKVQGVTCARSIECKEYRVLHKYTMGGQKKVAPPL